MAPGSARAEERSPIMTAPNSTRTHCLDGTRCHAQERCKGKCFIGNSLREKINRPYYIHCLIRTADPCPAALKSRRREQCSKKEFTTPHPDHSHSLVTFTLPTPNSIILSFAGFKILIRKNPTSFFRQSTNCYCYVCYLLFFRQWEFPFKCKKWRSARIGLFQASGNCRFGECLHFFAHPSGRFRDDEQTRPPRQWNWG